MALASDKTNPSFAPENFTSNYQRSLYSALRKLTRDRFKLLEQSMEKLNAETQELARKVLALEVKVLECFSEVYQVKINAIKTRIHGDYHFIDLERARYDENLQTYANSVLTAFREVETALAAEQFLSAQELVLRQAASLASQAEKLALSQYEKVPERCAHAARHPPAHL